MANCRYLSCGLVHALHTHARLACVPARHFVHMCGLSGSCQPPVTGGAAIVGPVTAPAAGVVRAEMEGQLWAQRVGGPPFVGC